MAMSADETRDLRDPQVGQLTPGGCCSSTTLAADASGGACFADARLVAVCPQKCSVSEDEQQTRRGMPSGV